MKIFDCFGKNSRSHLSNPVRSAGSLNKYKSCMKDQDHDGFLQLDYKMEAGWWVKNQKQARKLTSG